MSAAQYQRAYYARNAERIRTQRNARHSYDRHREGRLRRLFNMTLDDYDALFDRQGGACAICQRPETAVRLGKPVPLAVDHDHACCPGIRSCGKCIRGLLCTNCNQAIGKLNDDPVLFVAALRYLSIEVA